MAGCDLQILLDSTSGTYRNGETVTGRVIVFPQGNIQCNGLSIDRYWRTKGQGNTDRGKRLRDVLFQGTWESGRRYEYPFAFTAPRAPLTYEGKNFSIEHLIDARADVPFAFDPKATVGYEVVDGGVGGSVECEVKRSAGGLESLGHSIARGLHMLPFWSIGTVNVRVEGPVIQPRSRVPVYIRIRPEAARKIQGINARLLCHERSVKGSGKQRSVRNVKLLDRTYRLCETRHLPPNQTFECNGEIEIPYTNAISFHGGNNSVHWQLLVTIQTECVLPWMQSVPLVMATWSGEEMADTEGEETEAPITTSDVADPEAEVSQDESIDVDEPAVEMQEAPEPPARPLRETQPTTAALEPDPFAPNPLPTVSPIPETPPAAPKPAKPAAAKAAEPSRALAESLAEFARGSAFTGNRAERIESLKHRRFALNVEVEKLEWTVAFNSSPGYQSGRTVVGKILPDGPPVSLRFHESRNSELERAAAGQPLQVTASLVDWNHLYDRGEFEVE